MTLRGGVSIAKIKQFQSPPIPPKPGYKYTFHRSGGESPLVRSRILIINIGNIIGLNC